MHALIAALLVQYVISVKAGLVNDVQGTANVVLMETVRPGHSIRTGRDGHVEILLRPGSFLRLGEDSEAILDNSDLANVKVTIVHGPALVEASESNKDNPITITTGKLTSKIRYTGIYRFENGVATVLQGKLQVGDPALTYEKGWQVFFQDNYRARKAGQVLDARLDSYSQSRSVLVAQANLSMVSTPSFYSSSYGDYDFWVFCPNQNFYTYMPRANYRSPYGSRYYAFPIHSARQYGSSDNSTPYSDSSSTRSSDNNSNTGTSTVTSAPTVATPSGQTSAPSVYIDSKNGAVGATVR